MFASIQSHQFREFDCRIKADPIFSYKNILVYELVDSSFPNEIKKIVNGSHAGTFRHVALDTEGNCYLFDFPNKEIAFCVGKCSYVGD